MMIAGNGLQFPVVSDNPLGLARAFSFDCWPLPRSERAGSGLIVNRDRGGDAALGGPTLPRSSFFESLVRAFVHASNATKSVDGSVAFSNYGSSEPADRFDLKFAAVRGHGPSSAIRDKQFVFQNHLVDERLQGDTGATQQAGPSFLSDDKLRSFQDGFENAGQGAVSDSEEEILLREARYRALNSRALSSDAEEWKSLAHGTTTQQTISQVPNHQLMKMAELRLDKDVQKGRLGDRKHFQHGEKRADGRCEQPVIHHNQTSEGSNANPQTATGNSWTLAEVKCLPIISNSFWGKVGIIVLIAGALFIIIQLISSTEGSYQRHSVKRRIIRSDWYGNSGPQILARRDFQMRRSEFPRYPILEVDGDKKTFRFPFHASHAGKPNSESGDQWVSETKVSDQAYGQPVGLDTRAQYRKELTASQFTPKKRVQSPWKSNERALSASEFIPPAEHKLTGSPGSHGSLGHESDTVFSQHIHISAKHEPSASVSPMKWSILGGISRGGENLSQLPDTKEESEQKLVRMDDTSLPKTNGNSQWQEEDELDLDNRIRTLHRTVQAVEQHRRAALLALAEERQRSMELEVEINRQREAAAALGKEVQVLKESHNELLTSLRKKYSSSAAARAAADLIYQDWESDDGTSVSEAVAE